MKKNILAVTLFALLSVTLPTFAHVKNNSSTNYQLENDTLSNRRFVARSESAGDNNNPAYFVIITNAKAFRLDTLNAIKYLDPKWMAAVDFPDGPDAAKKYGKDASKGAVVITIDDEKYPNAFTVLKEYMALIGDHEAEPFYDYTTLPEGL